MMNLCVLTALALGALLARSTQTQATEIPPADFVPLEVGNQWTYKHEYQNSSYSFFYYVKTEPLSPDRVAVKAVFEVPGYPYEDQMAEDHDYPPTSLLYVMKELTIEITHTEMIDGFEYFVFSRADYDWPPVPNLFWAGQKVRLSDEGVLLLRWNGQDIPLYDFNPHHPNDYSIPEYPLLKNENKPVKVDIRRRIWEGSKNPYDVPNPPANLGQVFMALYKVRYPEFHILNFYDQIEDHTGIMFVTGYGLATYETFYPGFDASVNFMNRIAPISAIISGEEVLYEQTGGPNFTFFSIFGPWSLLSDFINGSSSVQSISWGQVKRYR